MQDLKTSSVRMIDSDDPVVQRYNEVIPHAHDIYPVVVLLTHLRQFLAIFMVIQIWYLFNRVHLMYLDLTSQALALILK